MPTTESFVKDWVNRVAGRLRFPYLFLLTATVFLLDLLIPDLLPFVDEIILGLFTVLLALVRQRKRDG